MWAAVKHELERTRLVYVLILSQEAFFVAFMGGYGEECELFLVGEGRCLAVAAVARLGGREGEWEVERCFLEEVEVVPDSLVWLHSIKNNNLKHLA